MICGDEHDGGLVNLKEMISRKGLLGYMYLFDTPFFKGLHIGDTQKSSPKIEN